MELYSEQRKAVDKLRSGSILCGGVGSGKTITSLTFYKENFSDKDLIVITTAKKRDSEDWEEEASLLDIKLRAVDSWNNITKYLDIKDSFFIFDEQRVVGYATWARAFIKIAKRNKWILLSATPGDTWMDYIPVFIANGFYKHKTEFIDNHVEYDRFVKYPKVKRYHNEEKLNRHRKKLLIQMSVARHTKRHKKIIYSKYDIDNYNIVMNKRWNIFDDAPIQNISELMQVIRKVINTDSDRIFNSKIIIDAHDKIIVFYNYNYELDILKNICNELGKEYYQWNGHKHEDLPDSDKWVYLVQYTSGAEGWNCTETNVILFYSFNYSYRITEQAEGRIDRLNTTFVNLHYYFLSSKSKLDSDIYKTVMKKKNFNSSAWANKRSDFKSQKKVDFRKG